MNSRKPNAAFTLLELLVVLAILAIVTALAVRTLDQTEDQRRYEASQKTLQDIQDAVVGSPEDRAIDGTPSVNGFVADMGRLPRTAGTTVLDLRELYTGAGMPAFGMIQGTTARGVAAEEQDPEVYVPGGWKGPYLHLPLGHSTLADAWGNTITSPADASPVDPDAAGYARLRSATDTAISTAGQEIGLIRLLGSNGRLDAGTLEDVYHGDQAVSLADKVAASLTGTIEVVDSNDALVAPDINQSITIRIFAPIVTDAARVAVTSRTVPFSSNPVSYPIGGSTLVSTIGARAVRAYIHPAGNNATSAATNKSVVKQVTLKAGANLLNLRIRQ